MPVKIRRQGGKVGYQFGDSGKFYEFDPDNEESKKRARQKAVNQGRAMRVNGWKGD